MAKINTLNCIYSFQSLHSFTSLFKAFSPLNSTGWSYWFSIYSTQSFTSCGHFQTPFMKDVKLNKTGLVLMSIFLIILHGTINLDGPLSWTILRFCRSGNNVWKLTYLRSHLQLWPLTHFISMPAHGFTCACWLYILFLFIYLFRYLQKHKYKNLRL